MEKRFETNIALVGYVYRRNFTEYSDYMEDLLQEGYLALWRSCNSYKEEYGNKFITYAYPAIYNAMLCYIQRYIGKYKNLCSLDTVVSEDAEGNQLLLIDIIAGENPSVSVIEVCLNKLEEKERHIIEKLLEGYTQDEIAVSCGLSQTTISRRIAKFRKLLLEEQKK